MVMGEVIVWRERLISVGCEERQFTEDDDDKRVDVPYDEMIPGAVAPLVACTIYLYD